jgi:hypothetical protein
MPVVSVLCAIPFPLCGISCDHTMAEKTYTVVFRIEGINGAVNQKMDKKENEIFSEAPKLREEVLNKFITRLKNAYPRGKLSADLMTFTTDEEVTPTKLKKWGPPFFNIPQDATEDRKSQLRKMNEDIKNRVSAFGSATVYGSIELISSTPAPAPKTAPKEAPKAAPIIADPSKPKKTYDVAFLAPPRTSYQNNGMVLFPVTKINNDILERFRSELTRHIQGELINDRTFTTSADLEVTGGKYKHVFKNLLSPAQIAELERVEGKDKNEDSDDEEEEKNVGVIELYPVAKGGKRRKTRRSTRRKRTTRRR